MRQKHMIFHSGDRLGSRASFCLPVMTRSPPCFSPFLLLLLPPLQLALGHVCSVKTSQATAVDPVRSCPRWRLGCLFQHCVSPKAVTIRALLSRVFTPLFKVSCIHLMCACLTMLLPSRKIGLSCSLAHTVPRLAFKRTRGRKVRSRGWGCFACCLRS